MLKLTESLDLFAHTIVNHSPLSFTKQGEWYSPKGIWRYIYRLNWMQNKALEKATNQFILALNELERQKVYMPSEQANAKPSHYAAYLRAGQALSERFGKRNSATLCILQQRLTALRYRIEGALGGLDPLPFCEDSCHGEDYKRLCAEALAWKSTQKYPLEDQRLSIIDKQRLQSSAEYAAYLPLLLRDAKLRNAFFKWTIRGHHHAAPFIQYPATCEKLRSHYIEPRIAYWGGLSIDKNACKGGGIRKELTQLFKVSAQHSRAISILNEDKEVLLHGRSQPIKIRDLFLAFKRKNLEVGDFEYFGQYEHYNCGRPPLDPDDPDLLRKMRTIYTYTYEEFKTAYAIPHLQKGQWVKLYSATRSTDELSLDGSHAFLKIAVPSQDGTYEIKSCGILASKYPQDALQTLSFLCKTTHGSFHSPDENIIMLHRQHCASPFILNSQDEVEELQEQIRRILRESCERRLIFQVGGDDNCAAKVQRFFMSRRELEPAPSGKVKNLFHVKFIKTAPLEPLGTLFKVFRRTPECVQSLFIKTLELFFGAHRKMKICGVDGKESFYGLTLSPFHKNHRTYAPTALAKKIEKNSLPGVIWFGPEPFRSRLAAEKT